MSLRDLIDQVYAEPEIKPARMTLTRRGLPVLEDQVVPPPEPDVPRPSAADIFRAIPGKFAAGVTEALTIDPVTFANPPPGEPGPLVGAPADTPARGMAAVIRDIQGGLEVPVSTPEAAAARARALERRRSLRQAEGELLPPGTQPNEFQEAVLSAARSAPSTMVGVGVGSLARGAGMVAGAGLGSLSTYENTFQEALEKTGDQRLATRAGAIDALLEFGGENVGIGALLKRGGPAVVRILKAAGVNAAEELVTQLGQDLNAMAHHEPDLPASELLKRARIATMAGGIMGGTIATATTGAQAGGERLAALVDQVYGGRDATAQGEVGRDQVLERAGAAALVPPEGLDRQRDARLGGTRPEDRSGDRLQGPAPGAAAEVARPVAEIAEEVYGPRQEVTLQQRAFHGSPHDFEEFQSDRIGTGEGAQAYGHGLYFSGKREVAEWYKKKLAGDRLPRDLGSTEFTKEGRTIRGSAEVLAEYYSPGSVVIPWGGGTVTDKVISWDAKSATVTVDRYADRAMTKGEYGRNPQRVSYGGLAWTPSDIMIRLIPAMQERGWQIGKPGRLYEVELAPETSDYLDWDKPLSEQSEKVQAALNGAAIMETVARNTSGSVGPEENITGQAIYRALEDRGARHDLLGKPYSPPRDVSKLLAAAGIPGITYKGALSGERNYVLFDDSLAKVVRKNDRTVEPDIALAQRTEPARRGYFDQQYKHSQPVRVTLKDGTVSYDAVKGLNVGHALWRAGENWPGAKIEPVTLDEVKAKDPEAHREISRFETFGLAQIPPQRQSMYRALVDPELTKPAPPVEVKPIKELADQPELPPTRGQQTAINRAAGQLVRAGVPEPWVKSVTVASDTGKDASPASYNLDRRAVHFREQYLNGVMAGEPGGQEWLATAMAHEVVHRIDHGGGQSALEAMASGNSPRLAAEGDLMVEAREAYFHAPSELGQYLAYPFATSIRGNEPRRLAIEVTAQMGSLYATARATLKQHAPKWHALFEEVFRHADVAGAHRALREGLRAQPAAAADQGLRPGARRGEGDRGQDRGSIETRAPGPGVGGVQTSPGGAGLAPPAQPSPPARGAQPGQPVVFDVAEPGWWDDIVRTFQDNKVDLKRLQAAIRELRPIEEAKDAYLKDELRISRTADKVDRFRKGKAQDLIEKIRKHDLKLDEVERFLWARHAREANAQLHKLTGEHGLSGMSNRDARQALNDFQQQGKLAGLRDVATTVDAIIDETRRIYVAGGLEKQATIDAWKQTYQHYVPLHREGFEDRGPSIGKGYTIRGPETKRRLGSKRAVENILANVFAQHEAAIVRAEKNRVDRALWDLFKANPNPAFWEAGRPGLKETLDVDTGLPVRVPDMNYKNVENALVLKIDGEEKVILFNEQNPRAREMVKAMRNLNGSELAWYVAAWAKANRLIANLLTAYNPVFWATNLARDVGTIAFNLQSTELKGKEVKVMRRIPLAMRGVRDELRGKGRSKWAQTYREAKAAGGMTGWMQSFEGITERAEEIVKLLRTAERGTWDPREMGGNILQLVKDYNDVVEHATRTAVYATAIDEGMSKDKAASLAKNMSVNFNRKGTASTGWAAFYMFFNASVQGSARMIEGAIKSKRVWAYMGIAMGIATALDVINRTLLADDDDEGNNEYDNISDEIKLRNFIVMRPGTGGKYWKIPMPYGYNVIANIGRVIGEFASKDDFEPWQAAGEVGKAAVMSFVPTGEAPTALQFISPSLLDPVAQMIENQNWQGAPLSKEQPERGPRLAQHERGLRTTPLWAKSLAREIAEVSEEKVSINPGYLAHVLTAYAGGLGYTVSQTYDLGQRLLVGEEVPTQTIPLASRFAGEDTEGARSRRFFELKESALALDGELRRLRKLGRSSEAAELERSKPHLMTFLKVWKAENQALRNLYREADSAQAKKMSAAERIAFQDEWAEKRGRIYSRVLRKSNEARR